LGYVVSLALIYTTTTLVRLDGGRVYCRLLYEIQSLFTLHVLRWFFYSLLMTRACLMPPAFVVGHLNLIWNRVPAMKLLCFLH
jgi:hypothetical protein